MSLKISIVGLIRVKLCSKLTLKETKIASYKKKSSVIYTAAEILDTIFQNVYLYFTSTLEKGMMFIKRASHVLILFVAFFGHFRF